MRFLLLLAAAALAAVAPAAGQTIREPNFDPLAIRAHVEFLADDLLEGRNAGTRGHEIAARYVATRFRALGLEPPVNGDWYQHVPLPPVPLDPQADPAPPARLAATSPNVLGVLRGSDPALRDEYVLLMAHLDHEGIGAVTEGEDRIFNGAMDNAAGTATMLEVARAFAEAGARPKRSILFAAVTAEEDGLIGSDHLAQHPVIAGGRIVAVVNLDMPILLYDFTDVIAFGAEHSTMGAVVARAGASMGVSLLADPLPEEGLFTRSDHYSFVRRGIPSVFLMTGFGNGGEARFREFLANTYHKPNDEADQPGMDWAAAAKFARLNYRIAREIADGAEAPRWYQGDRYGDEFAKGQPRAPAPAK